MSANPQGLFITGTDTGIGKTRIAAGLLTALQRRGLTTAAMKPVASGCFAGADGLRNEDALTLMEHATQAVPYRDVNPYALAEPIAPHLAAADAGIEIDIPRLTDIYQRLAACVDCVVVEGVGGWLVPLGRRTTVADLAGALGLSVVLVVGIRLGCLNHALLTADAIGATDLRLAGWVANLVEPDCPRVADNIEALRQRLRAPLLGTVPFREILDAREVAACLEPDALIWRVASSK